MLIALQMDRERARKHLLRFVNDRFDDATSHLSFFLVAGAFARLAEVCLWVRRRRDTNERYAVIAHSPDKHLSAASPSHATDSPRRQQRRRELRRVRKSRSIDPGATVRRTGATARHSTRVARSPARQVYLSTNVAHEQVMDVVHGAPSAARLFHVRQKQRSGGRLVGLCVGAALVDTASASTTRSSRLLTLATRSLTRPSADTRS